MALQFLIPNWKFDPKRLAPIAERLAQVGLLRSA
jgi:hypothetical protein